MQYKTFSDASAAKEYIEEQGLPIVVKADVLTAGKGVTVAKKLEEAYEAVEGVFGSAGCQVIVEEFLEGEEASFFSLVDGENAIALESAGDGDTLLGPLQDVVMETIIHPSVKGMAEEGCKFVGVLCAGLMIEKKSGLPKLIDFNVLLSGGVA